MQLCNSFINFMHKECKKLRIAKSHRSKVSAQFILPPSLFSIPLNSTGAVKKIFTAPNNITFYMWSQSELYAFIHSFFMYSCPMLEG